ncbi:MAG: hypothetical protein VW405_01320 [Rhodospirillaceae bacterium]
MLPIRAVGIPWYNKEDYPLVLKIMADARLLSPTYEEWRRRAEDFERAQKAQGVIVVRAIIDPKAFPGWCAVRGLNIDAAARTRFANERAKAEAGGTH